MRVIKMPTIAIFSHIRNESISSQAAFN